MLPNCYRFGVFIDGELVGTVRIHHISKAEPYGPVMKTFGDILRPRLAARRELHRSDRLPPTRLSVYPAGLALSDVAARPGGLRLFRRDLVASA